MIRPCAALLASVLALGALADASAQEGTRVVIDNPWVKVTRVSLAPGQTEDLGVSGEAITVWLTAWKANRERVDPMPGVKAFRGHEREAGRVEHRVREGLRLTNVGTQRCEAVTIEVKDGAPPVEGPYPDGPEAAPENIRCEFENDRLRVLRIRVGGNDALPMHGHSRRVVVEMTGSSFMTSADSGNVRGQDFSAGTTAWIDRATWHREINTSGVPYERITVELKSGAQPILRVKAGHRVFGVTDRGQGGAVVLIHDVAGDVLGWESVAARLAVRHRVIAYSRRGHFPNDRLGPDEPYGLQAHVQDLGQLLPKLTKGPVTLVGHGSGAAVAIATAKAHPEWVRRVVLVEPEPAWDVPQSPDGSGALLETVLKQGNEPLALETWIRTRWAPWQFKNLPVPVQERLRANESTVLPYLAQKPEPRGTLRLLVPPKVPYTLVLGDGHEPRVASSGERVETVPGAGRALPWVQPEALAAVLLRVLDRP